MRLNESDPTTITAERARTRRTISRFPLAGSQNATRNVSSLSGMTVAILALLSRSVYHRTSLGPFDSMFREPRAALELDLLSDLRPFDWCHGPTHPTPREARLLIHEPDLHATFGAGVDTPVSRRHEGGPNRREVRVIDLEMCRQIRSTQLTLGKAHSASNA